MTDPHRYDGKPFLRLVDAYVFWAIGQLPPDEERQLEELAPHLRRVYDTDGSWQQIVAGQLDVPDTLPTRLRELWDRNQQIARERNEELPATVFVHRVVDVNLAPDRS